MKIRRFLMVGLVCIFMVFGLTLNSLATEYPSITLRVTSAYPSATFANKLLHWFMEDVKEATAGKIKFQEYWGGSLLKGREILEGVQHGVTDLALLCPPYHPGKLPIAYSNYAFPFAPRSAAVMSWIVGQLYKEFPFMVQEFTKYNMKSLCNGTVSDYGILSRDPMTTLKEFKGKKIVQLGGYFADWTKASGIQPVSGITAGERYERLRTGVVEGSLLTPSFFVAYKEYEVANNCVMTGLGSRVPFFVVCNLKKWNTLTPQVQKLFMDIGQRIQKRHAEGTDQEMEHSLKILQANDVKYYGYLSDKVLIQWAALVPDTPATMCKSLEGKYPKIWDMAHRFIKLAEEKGHKWPRKFAIK